MSNLNHLEAAVRQELFDLVALEARLMDEGQFSQWLDLFADDAHYWMPLAHGQQDPVNHASLLYEDKLLLRMRVERLKNARAHSQQPLSRCLHVLQQPTVEAAEGETLLTRCAFTYFESRGDEQQMYGAVAWHHWVRAKDGFLLKLKRVNLLNCEAALPSIQLFM
jgi:3-phenylpropionate/cinnamic acid dioxygenase small subunit